MPLSRLSRYIRCITYCGSYSRLHDASFVLSQMRTSNPYDLFPLDSCITALHQVIRFLTQEIKQAGITWMTGLPGEFVFSPRALEKKLPLEWYETNIGSFRKQKTNKIQFKKQGLFDEMPRRHIREVQAPSSPIQLHR